MRKKTWIRRLAWVSFILFFTGMLALLIFPEPYYALKGFLWSEAFFDGYPSSYYRDMIVEERDRFGPPHSFLRFLRRFGFQFERNPPPRVILFPLQRGNVTALPVLRDLLRDPDPDVRFFALLAVEKIIQEAPERVSLPEMQETTPLLERLLEDRSVISGKKDLLRIAASSILVRMDTNHAKARTAMEEFLSKFPTGQ